jgi:oligopeptidase B
MKTMIAALVLGSLLCACQHMPRSDGGNSKNNNGASVAAAHDNGDTRMAAPIAKKVQQVIASANGDRVDQYQWLRDDTRSNAEVLDYLKAENAYHDQYFAPLQAKSDALFAEIKARIKEDDASVPVLDGGYWYYTRFVEGGQYPIYARRKGSMDAAEQVLLDGNAMAEGSGYFSIGGLEVSDDGQLLAYAVDRVGRRQYSIRFKDLRTGDELPDEIRQVTSNFVWAADNQSLFYANDDDETLLSYQIYQHKLGQPQASNRLVYQEPDNTFGVYVGRSKSQKYLIINSDSTLTTEARVLPADQPNGQFAIFLARQRGHDYSIDHAGSHFYIRSNFADAKNFMLAQASEQLPSNPRQWQTVIAHRSDSLVEDFELFADHVAVGLRQGGLSRVGVLNLMDRKLTMLPTDDPAFVASISDTPDLQSGKLRYEYSSLTTPKTVYEYVLKTGARTMLKQDQVLGNFQAKDYVSEFVFAQARDGTKVPVSIVYKRGTKIDGTAPLYQYGYGSYGYSMEPGFNLARMSLLDRGFVYAIAHIRGGEEMGREWYESGKLLKKKNTFSDFVDVTDFLVKQGYGAKDKIVAAGGSAGGLLMGAVVNMAPEKYCAIAAHVPFVDVVTTMLDESIPLTTGEFDEWGNPKEKAYYDYMLSYSPYDQVSAQNYPAMLVTTGLHDSQVQYWEPAKWVAKLRAMKTDQQPLLFKTNMEAGHGGKSGRFDRLREVAEEYVFFIDRVGR